MLLLQASARYLDGVKWGECSNGNLFLIDLTRPIDHVVVHIHTNTIIHDKVNPLKSALDNGLVLVFSNLVLVPIDMSNLI